MKYCSKGKHILLIDHQSYWRELFTQALQDAGFNVSTLATYDQVTLQVYLDSENPDLVVLGCTRIRDEELRLIEQVLDRKQHLLALCASVSWQIMRSLFLLGVTDIVDKPHDCDRLVKTVNKALASITPRNGYQAVERTSA